MPDIADCTRPISIHALLTESDDDHADIFPAHTLFQSTLSSRRATGAGRMGCWGKVHFNPRSPHGERRLFRIFPQKPLWISIHALLTESDEQCSQQRNKRSRISIHALLTESDPGLSRPIPSRNNFNPRSPHGERPAQSPGHLPMYYFNPRSPHGERRLPKYNHIQYQRISIHALLTESDTWAVPEIALDGNFNPRSPHGERPGRGKQCDQRCRYFNPRSPHGERQQSGRLRCCRMYFNPRSPHGERREPVYRYAIRYGISIHALLTESDLATLNTPTSPGSFQSTLSSRRATCFSRQRFSFPTDFNPRSPHGERHGHFPRQRSSGDISIHALLTESDLAAIHLLPC